MSIEKISETTQQIGDVVVTVTFGRIMPKPPIQELSEEDAKRAARELVCNVPPMSSGNKKPPFCDRCGWPLLKDGSCTNTECRIGLQNDEEVA